MGKTRRMWPAWWDMGFPWDFPCSLVDLPGKTPMGQGTLKGFLHVPLGPWDVLKGNMNCDGKPGQHSGSLYGLNSVECNIILIAMKF